ncbi:hypothetical protein OO010_11260 [Flavobacteriaceae bacterium KMM 6898]|nr:hypothetical protein [Flavobacteriaceae bacterium KMM 6898]
MKKKSTKVSVLGKKDDKYMLKFPHLHVKVAVNEELYTRMLHSSLYEFKPMTNEELTNS